MKSILDHAVSTVPVYRTKRSAWVGSLGAFPLSDRRSLVAAGGSCLSDAFQPAELAACTTSGTTGVPLTVFRDQASRYDDYFRTYRLLSRFVPHFFRGMAPGRCGILSVTDNAVKPNGGAINPSLRNALVLWRQARSAVEDLAGWCDVSSGGQLLLPLIAGRPSALLALSESLAGRKKIRAHAVLCSGENLYPDVRREIQRATGAPVYNAYASREGGFMAVECQYRHRLHALPGRVHLEVLTANGQVSEQGEGRLVITNLWNWAMPVIRYVTDDVGAVRYGTCPCGFEGQSITELYGRDAVYFDVGGETFNPSLLDAVFEGSCLEYHVVQVVNRGFEVRYRARFDLEDHIRCGMSTLLPNTRIDITRLTDSPDTESKQPRYEVRSGMTTPAFPNSTRTPSR